MARVLVRYKGIADVRRLSVNDLAGAGVKVDHELEWNRSNRFQLELDADDKFIKLLKAQGHFQVEAITDGGNGIAETIILPGDPRAPGDTVVFGPTGQRQRRKS
jgi:hypothetical protein